MLSDRIRQGAWQAVNVCLAVQPGERAAIIHDRARAGLADALSEALREAGADLSLRAVMEDFGARPEDGSRPLVFPQEFAEGLAGCSVSIYLAESRKGEGESFRRPMLQIVNRSPGLRHAHMPGVTEQVMAEGLGVDYRRVQEVSGRVFEIVRKAKSIRVAAPGGSDFRVDCGFRWLNSDGAITPERWMNLPAGEVFTCPLRLQGRVVVDGILGDHFAREFGLLSEHPLILDVDDSHVRAVECSCERLRKAFLEYTEVDKNAGRAGEFAIGTNIGLEQLSGVLLQDEKMPGVHVAFGHGYPEATGSGIYSKVHADGVVLKPSIWVDGSALMEEGRFLL